eukprot:10842-Heterococcus_DN1.PRE.2
MHQFHNQIFCTVFVFVLEISLILTITASDINQSKQEAMLIEMFMRATSARVTIVKCGHMLAVCIA